MQEVKDLDIGTILLEIAKDVGQFFLDPLLYLGFVFAVYLGYIRVKRERNNFNIRVQDGWYEFRTYLSSGWLLGLLFSLIIFVLGFTVPFLFILAATAVTFLLALTLKPSLLSPAYIMGFTFLLFFLLEKFEVDIPLLNPLIAEVDTGILPAIAVICGLLLIIEGIFILTQASKNTSPKVIRSKRGLKVGVHESKRLWMVPLVLLLPEGPFSIPLDFWPVVPIGSENFSIILVPFWIGFSQQISISLPSEGVRLTGKKVIGIGTLVTALAVAGMWLPVITFLAIGVAIVGRLIIPIVQHYQNQNYSFYFSKSQPGIVIVDIIPNSPAEKMELRVGEVIQRVNGLAVNNDREFYEALQVNRAFCKLEVIDVNGENRLVNRALYEGEHHELGILFVANEKHWEQDVS